MLSNEYSRAIKTKCACKSPVLKSFARGLPVRTRRDECSYDMMLQSNKNNGF